MIKLNIGGRTAALARFFSAADKSATLQFVQAHDGKTVVCLDTPPTPVFGEFVRELAEAGRVVVVRDHHDIAGDPKSPRDTEIRAAADGVRALLGAHATISNRSAHPACSGLVKLGEFANEDFVLVGDADADGLTAVCKALGVSYPELDADAALLDGPPTRRQGLSPLGELLNKAGATLPPFSAPAYEAAAAALYEGWAKAASGDAEARELLGRKVEQFDAMVAKAQALATAAVEVAPGVWLADVVGERGYHLASLTGALEERAGCRLTVIRKGDGPIAAKCGGVQFSLARHPADKESDLRSLLPPGFVSSPETGTIGNVPFLVHVSQEVWETVVLPTLRKE